MLRYPIQRPGNPHGSPSQRFRLFYTNADTPCWRHVSHRYWCPSGTFGTTACYELQRPVHHASGYNSGGTMPRPWHRTVEFQLDALVGSSNHTVHSSTVRQPTSALSFRTPLRFARALPEPLYDEGLGGARASSGYWTIRILAVSGFVFRRTWRPHLANSLIIVEVRPEEVDVVVWLPVLQ